MSDRIEKKVLLRAPPSRVWRAISDAKEFGAWFGFTLDGPFVPGRTVRGTFQGTVDEAQLREAQRGAGLTPSGIRLPGPDAVFCTVERVEPEHTLSFRWIPYAIDAEADPDREPTTLVEFTLEPVAGGTQLTIVESGFDRIPAHRRARAFHMNQGGWAAQAENLRRWIDGP
jgi:uncharacterized protein YndB with AHSA1/START domain